ncbi:MAG: DUF296 domain-containing protein, partial [Acidobacteria bacterium]|nr:DUF296 domain-containing protein [Acidobacteriota bacterium]
SGIGAVREAVLGYFDPDTRAYYKEELAESHEIAGMSGNLSLVDGEPTLHLHATLADRNHRTRAGHLFSARVSVTVEVECTRLAGTVERKWDEETGLKLLDLD